MIVATSMRIFLRRSYIWTPLNQFSSVGLRANCRMIEEVLCQAKDAALKFRGCFQAVCEPRSVSTGGGWLVRRGVAWCAVDRAWSSLNLPIELRSDPPFPHSLSLCYPPFLFLRTSLLRSSFLRPSRSVDPFLSLSLLLFSHFSVSHFHFLPPPILFTSHPSFALCRDRGNERLLRDVLLIGSLRQPRIWSTICMNYFLDESIPRQKWINEQTGISI